MAITIGYSIDNIVHICTRICFIRAIRVDYFIVN